MRDTIYGEEDTDLTQRRLINQCKNPVENSLRTDYSTKPPNDIKKGVLNPSLLRCMKSFTGEFGSTTAFLDSLTHGLKPREVGKVFKFRLELLHEPAESQHELELDHNRLIPSWVKLEVWKRDRGRCVICGSKENLHFDHIIPYSRGGSSLVPENIQILCAKHNLEKRARII